MSSPNDASAQVIEIIEEVLVRLEQVFRTGRLEWEYVAAQTPWWRAEEGVLTFNLNYPLLEGINVQILKECGNHPKLKNVASVIIEGRRIAFVFSPSIP